MSRIATGLLVLLGFLLVSGNSRAGWQRDLVCQGDCGGGCGPCPPRSQGIDREDRAEAAYDRKVGQFNRLMHEAHAAANAGDPEEAIRIGRLALAVLDDSHLRKNITVWQCQILTNQASRTDNFEEKIELVRRALAIYEFREGREWLNRAQSSLEGQKLNDQGRQAYKAGDYALAERLFKQAEQKDPDPVYAKNIRLASSRIKTRQEVSRLAETIDRQESAASAATASDLDFLPAGGAEVSTQGTTGVFGTTGNPAHPDLAATGTGPAVAVGSALEQLSSSAKSSQDAGKSGKKEAQKNLSGCGFDDAPCSQPDVVGTAQPAVTKPEAGGLAAHIPPGGRSDPAIQNSLAWFEKLQARQAETELKIEDIRKQIDSGAGDAAVLEAKSATLEQEKKQNSADQVEVKTQIKKRLVDLKLDWNESPQQTE